MSFYRLASGSAAKFVFRVGHVETTGWKGSRAFLSTFNQGKRLKTVEDLGAKAEVEVAALGRFSKLIPPRRGKDITHRIGSKFGGQLSLRWLSPPKSVLIVKKSKDGTTLSATRKVIEYFRAIHPDISIVVEPEVHAELAPENEGLVTFSKDQLPLLSSKIDFVVTLGGDGTVLHVSSLFSDSAVPPVLGISMGTLGFLMPHHFDVFERSLEDLIHSKSSILLRMRLECSVHDADGDPIPHFGRQGAQAMNEVHLHRGRYPHMTIIDAYVDGQHLTEAVADGLIVATPTGSTAYSLSAGGPIVHPSVQSLLLTPICPRSLSFRTVLLPSDVCVQLRISPNSRSPAELSLDGREASLLNPGELLRVSMSPYPVPCIIPPSSSQSPSSGPPTSSSPTHLGGTCTNDPQLEKVKGVDVARRSRGGDGGGGGDGEGATKGDDQWVEDINQMLKFNATFAGKKRWHDMS